MAEIQWGLLQNGQSGFQNALQMGLQAGQAASLASRQNAISGYAANPTREGLGGLAQANPEYAIRERGRFDQQDAAQAQQQQAQGVTMRQLLQHAGNGPEAAQQALAAAQQMGVDVSRFPPIGSAEFEPWRAQQLFIAEALETPEGRDELTAAAQEVMFSLPPEQRNVNDPAFIAAMRQHIQSGRVKTLAYQPGGNVIAYDPGTGQATPLVQGSAAPPAAQAQPVARQVGGATYFQGQDGTWYDNEAEARGGGGSNVTSGFPRP